MMLYILEPCDNVLQHLPENRAAGYKRSERFKNELVRFTSGVKFFYPFKYC